MISQPLFFRGHHAQPLIHSQYLLCFISPRPYQSTHAHRLTMALLSNLTAIREEIFKNFTAKRIIIKVNTEDLDSQDYRASANKVASEVFPAWESDPRILFLATDIWSKRSFIVVDINRHDYDFLTAHKDKTILPVYVLRQPKKRQWI